MGNFISFWRVYKLKIYCFCKIMGWTMVIENNGNVIGYKAGIASIEKVHAIILSMQRILWKTKFN